MILIPVEFPVNWKEDSATHKNALEMPIAMWSAKFIMEKCQRNGVVNTGHCLIIIGSNLSTQKSSIFAI